MDLSPEVAIAICVAIYLFGYWRGKRHHYRYWSRDAKKSQRIKGLFHAYNTNGTKRDIRWV